MMKTLFLQAPSFEGFDGGAGSRYQAKREIKSFWFPTWLAQPAALVPGSKLIDAPPARISLQGPARRPGQGRLRAVRHAHLDPVLRVGRQGRGSDEAGRTRSSRSASSAPRSRSRLRRAWSPHRSSISSRATSSTSPCKEVAEGKPWAEIDGISYRNEAGELVHNRDRAILENMDELPFVTERLQAEPAPGRLLHRLSAASLRLDLYRSWLQVALHLLPVAADGRRPSLPHALGRACDRRDQAGEAVPIRRSRNSSSTTTPSPTTCRAPKPSPASWASSA